MYTNSIAKARWDNISSPGPGMLTIHSRISVNPKPIITDNSLLGEGGGTNNSWFIPSNAFPSNSTWEN